MIQSKGMFANLPKNWQIRRFSEVVKDSSGGRIKLKKSELLENGDVPVVDQGKELIGGYTNRIDSRIVVKNPVIIFGDHTRSFKYIDFDFAVGADGTKILEANSGILPKYIYYYFTTLEIPNTGYNRHYKFLKDIVVPVPPFSVQKRIAETLDKADEIIKKRQAVISKLDDLVQRVFSDMFGDPVKNDKNFEVVKFMNVFNITTGKLDSNASVNSGRYPFFTCSKDVLSIDSYSYDKEALLLAGNNAAGVFDVKHYKGKFDAYQRTYILDLKDSHNDYAFFKILLESKLKQLQKDAIGSNTRYLTLSILERLEFIVPPPEMQTVFAKLVEMIQKKQSDNEEQSEMLVHLYDSLMQKSFMGELSIS